MKKFINLIQKGICKLVDKVQRFIYRVKETVAAIAAYTRVAVAGNTGEGYIDTAVKVIIALVIGGLLLAGLYTLFNGTIIPNLNTEIGEMFTYSGT